MMSQLIRVTHGIWRPLQAVDDLPGRLAALLAAAPPGTVVGGLAAARLHGLWLPGDAGDSVDLYLRRNAEVPERHAGSRRAEYRGRRRRVAPDEVEIIDGVPVTTAARTWVDLGELLAPPDLVAAGDAVLHGGVPVAELEEMVTRAARRRGIRLVRAMLPLLDGRARSRPESHMRFAVVTGGLPKPEVNQAVHDEHGQWLFEPDLGYKDVRLALEYNGALHAATKRMRRDITREVDAGHRGGWQTVTFGPSEVFKRPDALVAYVRELRRERALLFR
jgi:hypothetical protein